MSRQVNELLEQLAGESAGVAALAQTLGNTLISGPHLVGRRLDAVSNVSEGEERFQQLLTARVELRTALASVEDGINAVQVWRNR